MQLKSTEGVLSRAAIALVGIMTTIGCQTLSSGTDEVHATLAGADIGIPDGYAPEACSGRVWLECLRQIDIDRKIPVVVFLHGCSGPNPEAVKNILRLGYVVVAPNSLARSNRKIDCLPGSDKKSIMRLRFEEAAHAAAVLIKHSWIDERKLVLAGFSEGSGAAALYPGREFRARIIIGWTCRSPDSWWNGIRGASDAPVLAIVGSNDEYYKNTMNAGQCDVASRPDSNSVLIKGAFHNILNDWETWSAVKKFLDTTTH